jgi:hypothetical protein
MNKNKYQERDLRLKRNIGDMYYYNGWSIRRRTRVYCVSCQETTIDYEDDPRRPLCRECARIKDKNE